MSMASGLLQAAFGAVALALVWRFDPRDRLGVVEPIGSITFDPGVAILAGAIAAIVFGLASAVWSVVG